LEWWYLSKSLMDSEYSRILHNYLHFRPKISNKNPCLDIWFAVHSLFYTRCVASNVVPTNLCDCAPTITILDNNDDWYNNVLQFPLQSVGENSLFVDTNCNIS
jgi:hypothetical protein